MERGPGGEEYCVTGREMAMELEQLYEIRKEKKKTPNLIVAKT